jgi:serine/threonine protein kinase
VDYRADFYSLGAIFYHLLSGTPLFGEFVRGGVITMESALEISAGHRAQVPFPPTAGKHALLDQLVLQLLEKAPDSRYQTGTSQMNQANFQAKGLIHDLRAIGEGKTSPNFVVGQVDQSARFKFPRRNCALGGL